MSELGPARCRRRVARRLPLVALGVAAFLIAPSHGPASGRSAPSPLPLKGGRPLPDLAPWAVEVTQAINSALVAPHPYAAGKSLTYHGEPLVAGKKTVVRLYGTTTRSAGRVAGVAARLYGYNARGKALPGSPLAPVQGPAGAGDARVAVDPRDTLIAQRLNPARSWNFVLPRSWTAAGAIRLKGLVNPGGRIREATGGSKNDDLTVSGVIFFRTAALQIRPYFFVGPLSVPFHTVGLAAYPGVRDGAFGDGWLNSIMPVADRSLVVKVPPHPGFSACVDPGLCHSGDQDNLYLGLVDTATAFWQRDYYADPSLHFQPPATPYVFYDAELAAGPAGIKDGTIGMGWIGQDGLAANVGNAGDAAHEMLHNLGLKHAGNAHGEGPPGATDETWPFCHGELALPCAGNPDTSLRSAGVADNRPIGFDTAPTGGDLRHWATARDTRDAGSALVAPLNLSIVKDPIAHAPYPGVEATTVAPCSLAQRRSMHYHDMMTYGAGTCEDLGLWISTINYCRTFFILAGFPAPDGSNPSDFCKKERGLLSAAQLATLGRHAHLALAAHAGLTQHGEGLPAGVGRRQAPGPTPGPALVLSGSIDPAGKVTVLDSFVAQAAAVPLPTPASGAYQARVSDAAGRILAVRTLDVHAASSHHRPVPRIFTVTLPLSPQVAQIAVVRAAPPRRAAAAALPLLTLTRPHGVPSVTVLAPRPGSLLASLFPQTKPFPLIWRGSTPSGAPLTYDVALSADGGRTYITLAVKLHTTSLPLYPSQLPGGPLVLRVSAGDGFDQTSATVRVILPLRPPQVTIFSPGNGATLVAGTLATLSGQAIDPQSGILGDGALLWTSDRDGLLGSGPEVDTSSLSIGVHQITLSATAPDGLMGSATVAISVTAALTSTPTVTATPQPTASPTASPTATASPTPPSIQ